MSRSRVLEEVNNERNRQDEKFPDQHLPNGTEPNASAWTAYTEHVRRRVDRLASAGTLTWKDVFEEEFSEVCAETDPVKLRTELLQVAAVCVRWIEDLDRT